VIVFEPELRLALNVEPVPRADVVVRLRRVM
jgi:hypothetical protein